MGETDSRCSTLTADGGLGCGNSLLRQENRRVVRELVEAAVRDHVSSLDALNGRVVPVRNARLHRLLDHVIRRPLSLAARAGAGPGRLSASASSCLLWRNSGRSRRTRLIRAVSLGTPDLVCSATLSAAALTPASRRAARTRLDQIHEGHIAVVLNGRRW